MSTLLEEAPSGTSLATDASPSLVLEYAYAISELAALTGWPRSRLYRAVREGRLRALMPNGVKRGMRILGSDYLRWTRES